MNRTRNPGNPVDWTRGDIVAAKPDTHRWGRNERPPIFVRIDVPDLAFDDSLRGPQVAPGENGDVLRKARYTIDLDGLPANFRGLLVAQGRAQIPWGTLADLFRDKATNAPVEL